MGIADVLKAFNEVAQPQFTAHKALMTHEVHDTTQFQILNFYGISASGGAFDIRSDRIRPNADLMQAARATAQRQLDTLNAQGGSNEGPAP